MEDDILLTIEQKGYWTVQDPEIGTRASCTLKPRIELQTIGAMELCKISTSERKQNTDTIDALFDEPVVVFYRGFGQTKRVHCFRNNLIFPVTPRPSMLVLCLCSESTHISLFERSHLYWISATDAPNGMFAMLEEQLDDLIKAGKISKRDEYFDQGGFILADGRLGWKILQGKVAFLGIVEKLEANSWAKMPLPETNEHRRIVEEMGSRSTTLCTNFHWKP